MSGARGRRTGTAGATARPYRAGCGRPLGPCGRRGTRSSAPSCLRLRSVAARMRSILDRASRARRDGTSPSPTPPERACSRMVRGTPVSGCRTPSFVGTGRHKGVPYVAGSPVMRGWSADGCTTTGHSRLGVEWLVNPDPLHQVLLSPHPSAGPLQPTSPPQFGRPLTATQTSRDPRHPDGFAPGKGGLR